MAFESLEIAPVRLAAVPDVAVFESDTPSVSVAQAAAIPAPLMVTAAMQVPTRYARLEIRTVGDETLVTAIELLSPASKRFGADGAEAYERKRQEVFRSTAHLLEIDLLRHGQRPQTITALPDAPYMILLSRAERRPHLEAWPCSCSTPFHRCPCRYATRMQMS